MKVDIPKESIDISGNNANDEDTFLQKCNFTAKLTNDKLLKNECQLFSLE